MVRQFLIVTQADDLHGLAIQAAVRRRGYGCYIVESNQLAGRESITFMLSPGHIGSLLLRTADATLLDVSDVQAIWLRRFRGNQHLDQTGLSPAEVSCIDNDCVGALIGSLQTAFTGKWISSPRATDFASNKLAQLAAAHRVGFRIPDTLVTQSPQVLTQFLALHDGRVIVKPVAGTPGPLLFTQFVRPEHIAAPGSIRASPAIYQEYIPGKRHIRLNCFGDLSHACLIETEQLDWRPNLGVPIRPWDVPAELHSSVRRVLDVLELDMGIVDLKQAPDGEFVWLEVNPQGQFLFLEGLTGLPLTELFADYFTTSHTPP